MKKLVLLLCVLSAVGCVKSYEDYYTRSFVLSYGNMRGISVAMTDFGLGYSVDFVGEGEWDVAMSGKKKDFYKINCAKNTTMYLIIVGFGFIFMIRDSTRGVSGISSIWRCGVPPTGMPNILRGRRSTIWRAFPATRPGPIFRAAIRKNTMNN